MTEAAAIVAAGLFTGAAVYISLVEHPARMECGTLLAATQWAPSYRRATLMQVSLALLGSAAGLLAWWQGSGVGWLIGALLLFSVMPFTLVAILPTNTKLLDPSRDKASAETGRLLQAWGRLHGVRSLLSLGAFLTFALSL